MLSITFILDIGSDIYPIPKSTFIIDISALKKLKTLRQKACLSVTYEPAFCICENKDADHREADQCLFFRYTDSTIPLLPKSEFQAFSHPLWLYSPVCVGPGGKPPKTGFLTMRLKCKG